MQFPKNMLELLKKLKEEVLFLALLSIYVYLAWDRIFQDFWSDEIYTLKHFVFVPIVTTLNDYHVPNNHVLFSLLLNVYAKVVGLQHMTDAFLQPQTFRVIPLAFSVGTIFTVFRIGQLLSNRTSGVVSASILIFTLSFYEFGLQLRGYSLSIFLSTLITYFSLRYLITNSKYQPLLIGFLVTLLAYTIPSNYYFIFAILTAVIIRYVVLALLRVEPFEAESLFKSKSCLLVVTILLGVVVSLICYLPIIKDVFYNQYVDPIGIDLGRTFHTFYTVISGFLSRRSVIIVLFLLATCLVFRSKALIANNLNLAFLVILFCLPFIISAFRGDNPPPRTFINLSPVFAVIIGTLIATQLFNSRIRFLLVLTFCLYGVLSFHYEQSRLSGIVVSNLHKSHGPSRAQELNYAYYSYAYSPLKQIQEFLEKRTSGKTLVIGDAEPNGLEEYLKALNVDFEMTGLFIPDIDGRPWVGPSLGELVEIHWDGFFFVTRFPNRLFNDVVEHNLRVNIVPLSKNLTYHNFFYIEPL